MTGAFHSSFKQSPASYIIMAIYLPHIVYAFGELEEKGWNMREKLTLLKIYRHSNRLQLN